MKSKTVGIVLAFAIIAFVIVYAVTGGFFSSSTTVDVGSMTIEYPATVDVEQPFSASSVITDGNYDSLDNPSGTSFVAESPIGFIFGGISLSSSSADMRVDYGYGDTHVENSVSAPTSPVVIGSLTIPLNAGLERIPIFVRVPTGKHPFVRVIGAASNGHITMIGIPE